MEYVATIVSAAEPGLSQSLLESLPHQLRTSSVHSIRAAWLKEGEAADIFYKGSDDIAGARRRLKASFGDVYDTIVQPAATRRKKLLIADMESTIIEQEMLDELAAMIGEGEKVASITRRAMNGELDFTAALKERVALLKGKPAAMLDEAAKRMTMMPGAEKLVATMRAHGAHCWLVSGGFNCFVKPIAERLGFDRFFANELVVRSGVIAGEVADPILDKNAKKAVLEKACGQMGFSPTACLAVGDGANDIPMLEACNAGGGMGVAYHAKPRVREAIPNQVNHGDLTALLYAQGYKQEDFANPTSSFRT